MDSVGRFLASWAESIFQMLADSALLLLAGLALAGVVRALLNERNISRLVEGNKVGAVFKAALFGVPLPLCSCSVLPVAYQLRQSGLSRGATVSFLIATPESGIDSIMLTYSLIDPVMTIARPLTAFLTAAAAGLTEMYFDGRNNQPSTPPPTHPADTCLCDCTAPVSVNDPPSLAVRLWAGLKYAFTDLLTDLAPYLAAGYILAGLVGALFGGAMFHLPEVLQTGWGAYAAAILIGVPLYVCATSSTPLAAALLAAGFSPGPVLVFMMVGPATNVASLVVVSRILKGWAVVRYLLSIVLVALLAGVATDWIYGHFGFRMKSAGANAMDSHHWIAVVAASVLTILIVLPLARKLLRRT
ncbi:MAG TPA: SO_0444 family Cu/Zn efflux transporter [Candidatus Deferrimicrobium sp.]|nr:SO_0444 family Cu/Zn efflux transporter [Candidatus Deferrimicrobium sp.]